MSTLNKEKILIGLRAYHTNAFPSEFPNNEAARLKIEIETLEDAITSMLLKLINGKAEFMDSSDALNAFREKVIKQLAGSENVDYKNILLPKINQLSDLLAIAKESVFKLKPVKLVKVA